MNNAGAFVLLPKGGDWQIVKNFVADVFNGAASPETLAAALPPKINVEILNGTAVVGLAQKTASLLEAAGFTVSKVANAGEKDYQKTVIYDLNGKNPDAVTKLRTIIDANLSPGIPAAIIPSDKTDFLIILGKNAAS
jgi:hypothetical protein